MCSLCKNENILQYMFFSTLHCISFGNGCLSFISWISNGILKVSISYICIVYEYDMVSMNTNEKLNVSKYKKRELWNKKCK